MVGWHHRLNGHELEQAPRGGEGQGNLAWHSPRDSKELDTPFSILSNLDLVINESGCAELGIVLSYTVHVFF